MHSAKKLIAAFEGESHRVPANRAAIRFLPRFRDFRDSWGSGVFPRVLTGAIFQRTKIAPFHFSDLGDTPPASAPSPSATQSTYDN